MKIVVLSFKIVPAARPPVRPPSARRPPVRPPPVRPSVRPPGPGPAEPIYIKLPIDRHGWLLQCTRMNKLFCSRTFERVSYFILDTPGAPWGAVFCAFGSFSGTSCLNFPQPRCLRFRLRAGLRALVVPSFKEKGMDI